MRRKHQGEIFGKSFDSFLGVVTKNGLGMLILVAMASTFTSEQTLSQGKFRRDLGTPMVRWAPPDRTPIFFECRGNRVLPIDIEFVRADVGRIFGVGFPSPQIADELNGQKKTNEYHRIEYHPEGNRVKVLYKPRDGKVGFSLAEFKDKERQSDFNAYLDRWKGKDHVAWFMVRPDSFEVFRQARDLARDKGFLFYWEPLIAEKEAGIVFGGGGGGQLPID
jgi:hypothetical protein